MSYEENGNGNEPHSSRDKNRDDAIHKLLVATPVPQHRSDFWSDFETASKTSDGRGVADELQQETEKEEVAVIPIRPSRTQRAPFLLAVASFVLIVGVAVSLYVQTGGEGQTEEADGSLVQVETPTTPQAVTTAQPDGQTSATKKNAPPVTGTQEPELSSPLDTPLSTSPDTTWSKGSLAGSHGLTYQFINSGSSKRGTVDFVLQSDGTYEVSGIEYGTAGGYVEIFGTVTEVSETELKFVGTVTTEPDRDFDDSDNASNENCRRQLETTFLSTQGRKYWRMQDMAHCEQDYIDYVDIYF